MQDLDVVVQAGVGWVQLNDELKAAGTGLFFPVDPGPGATIGTVCNIMNATHCISSPPPLYFGKFASQVV